MKLSNPSSVPVYTVSGSSTARPLPEWLARKRKRSLKNDPEYANRVELLQDFEFEEASQRVRISEDGEWIMSTGTYKPQMHVHSLPQLSLSFARHTDALNHTFELLSSDYSKSLHLQADRTLQFHTPQGCHYTTRIPRYGRDLKYSRHAAEALVPAVGVDADGMGEVYRLNLELGRFMKSYSVDVGGDDLESAGAGALQGGIRTGAVNTAAIAETSHNLLAFGTSLGTVEFWDPRARSRAAVLGPPSAARAEITALEFHRNGLTLGTGNSEGLVYLYDLRSPVPTLKKDQGYGFAIQNIQFLASSASTAPAEPKVMTADKRIIKLWDEQTGAPWTSVEPAVDLHDVQWVRDSGMLLTANEGRQQHSFFIPQLGPAPKWCSFLDNLVEEMAEDSNDPAHFNAGSKQGQVYDNYRFVPLPELKALNLDHLIGKTGLLRPYMHGFFVAQQLYEEARLIAQPEAWLEQRQKTIRERIEKERASRIRGAAKTKVKVNQQLAERLREREEKNQRRKARRLLKKADEAGSDADEGMPDAPPAEERERETLLTESRFAGLFTDEDFAVDEGSYEFRAVNPSTTPATAERTGPRGLTAAQAEELDDDRGRSSDPDDSESASGGDEDEEERRKRQAGSAAAAAAAAASSTKFSSSDYKKGRKPKLAMAVSSSGRGRDASSRNKTFGARAADLSASSGRARKEGAVVGNKAMTWNVGSGGGGGRGGKKGGKRDRDTDEGSKGRSYKERRSGSKNTFRGM